MLKEAFIIIYIISQSNHVMKYFLPLDKIAEPKKYFVNC